MNDLIERLEQQAVRWDGFGKTLPPRALETEAIKHIKELEDGLRTIAEFRARHGQADVLESGMASSFLQHTTKEDAGKNHDKCRWFCGEGCPAEVY